MSQKGNIQNFLNHNITDKFFNKTTLIFIILFITALSFRAYYFPYDIPLIADALSYFSYATDIVYHNGNWPSWSPVNNGWPLVLSWTFSILSLDNTLEYMEFQRWLSVFFSLITSIPLYFLFKKFFPSTYALVGVSIFLFEPRIILNSFLGITESLFIFLVCLSLLLFLHDNKKIIYFSFAIVSLATIIRSEGLFLFLTFSIMFIIRFRKDSKVLLKYLPAIIIFAIILFPIISYRIEVSNTDGIFLRAGYAISQTSSLINNEDGFSKLLNTPILYITYFGWVLLPVFIFFIPYGIIEILRQRDVRVNVLICYFVTMNIPILYAYSVSALDTRYLYTLYPIFCIISLFAIRKYERRFKNKKSFLILLTLAIILISLIFYELKSFDVEKETEVYEIAKHVVTISKGVNADPKISSYIRASQISDDWPFPVSNKPDKTKTVPIGKYNSLSELIKDSNENLSHILINEEEQLPDFLKDIVEDPVKYPYLIEEYNSSKYGYSYSVLVYKIDYEKFRLMENKID